MSLVGEKRELLALVEGADVLDLPTMGLACCVPVPQCAGPITYQTHCILGPMCSNPRIKAVI